MNHKLTARTAGAKARQRAAALAAEFTPAAITKLMAIAGQSPVEHGNGDFEVPSVVDSLHAIGLLLKLGETAAEERHEMTAEEIRHSLERMADRLGYRLVPKEAAEAAGTVVERDETSAALTLAPDVSDAVPQPSQALATGSETHVEILPPGKADIRCRYCGARGCKAHRDPEIWDRELARDRAAREYRPPSPAWPNGRIARLPCSAEQGTGSREIVVYTGRRGR